MPRKLQFNLVGVPQHVIQRGNNRVPCFFGNKKGAFIYINLLEKKVPSPLYSYL